MWECEQGNYHGVEREMASHDHELVEVMLQLFVLNFVPEFLVFQRQSYVPGEQGHSARAGMGEGLSFLPSCEFSHCVSKIDRDPEFWSSGPL